MLIWALYNELNKNQNGSANFLEVYIQNGPAFSALLPANSWKNMKIISTFQNLFSKDTYKHQTILRIKILVFFVSPKSLI
jgi:hypothetical protein